MLHGDVFRPPQYMPELYCVFMGTGFHLALTSIVVIVFSLLGVVSPARRGSLLNAALVVYDLGSASSGYISGRLYKAFGGHQWKECTVLTATLFPGVAFGLFFLNNIMFAWLGSTASASFVNVTIVAGMWVFISTPLTF